MRNWLALHSPLLRSSPPMKSRSTRSIISLGPMCCLTRREVLTHLGVTTKFVPNRDDLFFWFSRVLVIKMMNGLFDLDDAVLKRLPRRLFLEGEEGDLEILLRRGNATEVVEIGGITERKGNFSRSSLKRVCGGPSEGENLSL